MYYIKNETGHIIAADSELLKTLSKEDVVQLNNSVILEKINFSLKEDELKIISEDNTTEYIINTHILSSMLGKMTLIEIVKEKNEVSEEELIGLILKETEPEKTLDIILEDKSEPEETIDILLEEDLSEPEETLDILLEEDKSEPEETIDILLEEDVSEPEKTLDVLLEEEEFEPKEELNINEISEKIGISSDEYTVFLGEFISLAISLKEDLKEASKKKSATGTLSHLASVLHLTDIEKTIKRIELSEEEKEINNFYSALEKINIDSETKIELEPEVTIELEPEPKQEETIVEEKISKIDLSTVSPIHFDFQMSEAAKDLSLPVDLIEEFVNDFLGQANTETEKMLAAYDNGDLKTIHEIGHLLKGTASNLRINPLADTLEKIQFCEDLNQFENLVKDYWGHFISFEKRIKMNNE